MSAHAVLVGPSGVGKSTLARELVSMPGLGMFGYELNRPWVDRPRRRGENHEEYTFVTPQEFAAHESSFLFTMRPYDQYNFGMTPQPRLSRNTLRLHILLAENALRLREQAADPVVICAVLPEVGQELGVRIKERDPSITFKELGLRVAASLAEIEEAKSIADLVHVNTEGILESSLVLMHNLETHCVRSGLADGNI